MADIQRALDRPLETRPAALDIRGVHKTFPHGRKRLAVLAGVNLAARTGEFVCLLGPSGCGKSTLLHLVAGLERPDAGEIRVSGRPVVGPGPERVVVFQDGGLFPWLTVRQNVELGLKARGVPAAERRQRALAMLDTMRLGAFAGAYIHQLSGGMRQRVAIARAFVMQPDFLLMDEPFAALDAQTRNVLQDELQRLWLNTGATVLFVTHSVVEAVRLASRLVVFTFRPGRIRRVVELDHPHPRGPAEPRLMEVRQFLLRELADEVHAQVEEELSGEA